MLKKKFFFAYSEYKVFISYRDLKDFGLSKYGINGQNPGFRVTKSISNDY